MRRRILVLLATFGPSQADAASFGGACYTGKIMGMKHDEYLDAFKRALSMAGNFLIHPDDHYKKFVDTRKECQHRCFNTVMDASAQSLVGALGKKLEYIDHEGTKGILHKALNGAFRTCYPTAEHSEIEKVINEILETIVKWRPMLTYAEAAGQEKRRQLLSGSECEAIPDDKEYFMTSFRDSFPKAIDRAVEKTPSVGFMLAESMRDCQERCLYITLPSAAEVLWDSGMYGDSLDTMEKALIGGFTACLPGQKEKDLEIFVHEVGLTLQAIGLSSNYGKGGQLPIATVGAAIQRTGLTGAISFAILGVVGLAIGNRVRRSFLDSRAESSSRPLRLVAVELDHSRAQKPANVKYEAVSACQEDPEALD